MITLLLAFSLSPALILGWLLNCPGLFRLLFTGAITEVDSLVRVTFIFLNLVYFIFISILFINLLNIIYIMCKFDKIYMFCSFFAILYYISRVNWSNCVGYLSWFYASVFILPHSLIHNQKNELCWLTVHSKNIHFVSFCLNLSLV